ncbi:hypothetical protein L1987_61592 [Smallanthus sonchifolius]|uniref:Uncharacterized protein n=1 Tax=Smallanthus sonchifolius TaxID=185202 RepID=A0ACB9C8C0_9ASTR|nr:hypothetical protein L1987_61592 [Smallanthus sonchifolius]
MTYDFPISPLLSVWGAYDPVRPVHNPMATFFPQPYVHDVFTWVNQEPMHSYRPPNLRHEFEAFLEDSLMRHELEADAAPQQRLIVGTSGSGLSEEKISKHLHVSTALMV